MAVAVLLPACGAIEYQGTLVKPSTLGRPYQAGIGDTVIDLKQTQSLPSFLGKADIFGRTRDAGRLTVRLVGIDGDQAIFVRQDVIIQSNESVMTHGPTPVPVYQGATATGSIGSTPASINRGGWGITWVPADPAYSYPLQAGQVQLTTRIGGSLLVEGRRLTVLRATDSTIEYSVE